MRINVNIMSVRTCICPFVILNTKIIYIYIIHKKKNKNKQTKKTNQKKKNKTKKKQKKNQTNKQTN